MKKLNILLIAILSTILILSSSFAMAKHDKSGYGKPFEKIFEILEEINEKIESLMNHLLSLNERIENIEARLSELENKTCTGVTDADGDGYASDVDCNDNDASIYPGASELCNSVDDNCNGVVDENVCEIPVVCDDGNSCTDDFYDSSSGQCVFIPADGIPCDDGNPGTVGDTCLNGVCTGTILADNDGDGYPSTTDCNDNDPDINPGAVEICNGIDDNCNGLIDEELLNCVNGNPI